MSIDALHFWLPIVVFCVVFAAILSEMLDKAIITAIGALLLVVSGMISADNAFESVDFSTLSLLLGMMILVECAAQARLFELLSVKILAFTRGKPLLIFLLFVINTLFLSSFLNNVTTILIILPLTIEIARGIGLNLRPFIIGEIVAANIGGLLTLIGDPVNTIVGTKEHLGMLDFLLNLSVPVFVVLVLTLLFLWASYRRGFKGITDNFIKVLHNILVLKSIEERFDKIPLKRDHLWISSIILIATILLFLFSGSLGFSPGTLALGGASVAMLLLHKHVSLQHIMEKVEWQTLVFFAGLFIIVGSLERTGVLTIIANNLAGITDNPQILIGILLVGTGIVSALVDNVPFVTLMIPVMESLLGQGLFSSSPAILWWTLSLGAVIGGMASPFGSSANVVAIGTAKKAGYRLTTAQYLRFSLPISIGGMLVSYLYLITAYEF